MIRCDGNNELVEQLIVKHFVNYNKTYINIYVCFVFLEDRVLHYLLQ